VLERPKAEALGSLEARNNSNGKCKDEIQGSLHYAAHDETVSGFGRDDDFFGLAKRLMLKGRDDEREVY
jgi:hypothetical protein